MNVSNKKEKTTENLNVKKNLKSISLDIINNGKKANQKIFEFSSNISNIYIELELATKDYCDKINQIIEKLNNKNVSNKGFIYEFENNLHQMLKEFIEIISKFFINGKHKKNIINNEEYKGLELNLNELEQILFLDIDKLEFNKAAYHQEFKKCELDLINEELNKDKKKDKIDNSYINLENILVFQKSYIDTNKKIREELNHIFNVKMKFLLENIMDNRRQFLKNINTVLDKIRNKIDKEKTNTFQFEEYSKFQEDIINTAFHDDIYEFKFLSLYKYIQGIKEDINCKKNGNDDLYDKLSENNIENIAEKLRKYDIYFNQENTKKINLIKLKRNFETIIKNMLNTPEKLDKKEKDNFLLSFESSTQNQLIFLQYLNNHRTGGKLNLKKETIELFCEIFLHILNFCDNNFIVIKFIIILCQTYYYEKNKEKIYMVNLIKKSNIFHDKNFWSNYLKGLIEEEQTKIDKKKNDKISKKQMSTSVYSSIFTLTKNMIDFDLDMDFISSLNNEAFNKYDIPDSKKKDIINYLIIEFQNPENH